MKRIFIALCLCAAMATAAAQSAVRPIPYGNMDQWVTRNIQESRLIGGQHKRCYAIGPTATIEGDKPYNPSGGSPWATSNVMAKVMGITKVSNAVFPDTRGSGKCARLTTIMENCKAIGLINIDVLVAGTMFLGRMLEPVKSTSDPYGKMEMGIPFDGRPSALVYDYKLHIPANGGRIYSSGFGKKKNLPGTDKAEVFIILQRRWEDSQGNIHARRVGTGRELMAHSTPEWVDGHELTVHYGDISSESFFRPYMGLIPESKSYFARNSRGDMVPVVEEGWDSPDARPTHLIVMFSAGSGEPFTGTPGLTLWGDNVGLQYDRPADYAAE